MKSVLKFIGAMIVVFALGIFLAPVLHDFLPFKFHRIFNRIIMIGTIISVFLFVRVRRENFSGFGLEWRQNSLTYFLKGFAAGFSVLAVLTAIRILADHANWAPKADLAVMGFISKLMMAMLAGLVIGVIEEFFFRGMVFQNLVKRAGWPIFFAILFTSTAYSLVHFLADSDPFISKDPTYKDSIRLILAPLQQMVDFKMIWKAALGLFIFGCVLNQWVLRTGSLYPAIGLHAGCVFFIKADGVFVDFLSGTSFWWGSSKLYDGVLGWLLLGSLSLIGLILFPRKEAKNL